MDFSRRKSFQPWSFKLQGVSSFWVRCVTQSSIPSEKEAFEQVSRMCLGGLKFVELLTTSSRFQFVVEFRKGNLICTNNWKIWQSNHGSRLWRTTSARATQRYNGRFYRSMLTEHKINRLLFFQIDRIGDIFRNSDRVFLWKVTLFIASWFLVSHILQKSFLKWGQKVFALRFNG